jgi:hypothetical protein
MPAEAWIVIGGVILAGVAGAIWSARQYDRRGAAYQKQIDAAHDVHRQSQALLDRQEGMHDRSLAVLDRQEEVIGRSHALLDRQDELMKRAELLLERLEKIRSSG